MPVFLLIGSRDFENLHVIVVHGQEINSTDVHLYIRDDDITLEFNEIVVLRFTPINSTLIADIESAGEYIRDTANVHIIDNDSKCALMHNPHFLHFQCTLLCMVYLRGCRLNIYKALLHFPYMTVFMHITCKGLVATYSMHTPSRNCLSSGCTIIIYQVSVVLLLQRHKVEI